MMVQYLRLMSHQSLRRKIAELPAYLRYRLRNRSEPAIVAARQVRRTIRRLFQGRVLTRETR